MKIFDTSALDEKMMPLLSLQEAAWIYNGLDVCVTAEVYATLMAQLEEEPPNVRATYEMSLAKMAPIMEMSLRGTYINEEARQLTIRDLEADLNALNSKFQKIMKGAFGFELNWRSPLQLKNLFYGVLGLKEVKKRNSQGIFAATVNREALEYFDIYLYARPLARFILAMRDIDKQLGFLKTEIDKDQRIRTTYNIAGTNTGRLASSMSEFGTGTNLQNVNRKLRFPFTADPGMYMVNVDLEQADGRNVGAICHNIFYAASAKTIATFLEAKEWNGPTGPEFASAFLDACESGDLHTTVCRMTWPELDWPDVSQLDEKAAQKAWKKFCDGLIAHGQDSYRQLAKKLGHGCLTADHEVLTPEGWVSISEKPKTIMAWEPVSGHLQWEVPSHWEDKPWHGDMYAIEGNQYSMYATADHRMPVFTRKGKFVEKPAELLSLYPEHNLKCAETFVNIGSLNISIHPGGGVQVYCPTVPSSGFITRRNGVIMSSLNTNYYGTPRTMAKHAHVPTKIIEDFQSRYFAQFPVIKAWHNWTINEIKTHGTLTTPFGRRRMFFGRGNDASTWRKSIAYSPQSMTGEQIDRGLLQIWRKYPQVQLLNQVHDSILFQLPFREAEHLVPEILKTMQVTIPLAGGRQFTVPLEAAGGWNWGYADKNNQHGLTKWTGKEDRDRPSYKTRLQDYLAKGRTS